MKTVGVIPARYASTRLPGKPLADILGKPMIWWVYRACLASGVLDQVVVATDDDRIMKSCEKYSINYIATSKNHPNHIARVHETAKEIDSDYFICVNGDEPTIAPDLICAVIPKRAQTAPYFGGLMREIRDPAEVLDSSNIKIAVTSQGIGAYMSRSPIPYPQGTRKATYKKYIGIECFNRPALDAFVESPPGILEAIEDIDHLRYLDLGIPLHFTLVESDSLSVDTPKDLTRIRQIMAERYEGADFA